MSADESSVQDRASRLPRRERARLALRLIESLDPGCDEDADELWLQEAERRLETHDKGASDARDAQDVIKGIDRQIK